MQHLQANRKINRSVKYHKIILDKTNVSNTLIFNISNKKLNNYPPSLTYEKRTKQYTNKQSTKKKNTPLPKNITSHCKRKQHIFSLIIRYTFWFYNVHFYLGYMTNLLLKGSN